MRPVTPEGWAVTSLDALADDGSWAVVGGFQRRAVLRQLATQPTFQRVGQGAGPPGLQFQRRRIGGLERARIAGTQYADLRLVDVDQWRHDSSRMCAFRMPSAGSTG